MQCIRRGEKGDSSKRERGKRVRRVAERVVEARELGADAWRGGRRHTGRERVGAVVGQGEVGLARPERVEAREPLAVDLLGHDASTRLGVEADGHQVLGGLVGPLAPAGAGTARPRSRGPGP